MSGSGIFRGTWRLWFPVFRIPLLFLRSITTIAQNIYNTVTAIIYPSNHAMLGTSAAPEHTVDSALIEDLHENAVHYLSHYSETRRTEFLQMAIELAQGSAQSLPALMSHPRRSEILRTYHFALFERIRLTRSPLQTISALMLLERTLRLLSEDDPYSTEAVDFMIKISNVHRPVEARQDELKTTDLHARQTKRARVLYWVSDYHFQVYGVNHVVSDLDRACGALRKTLDCAPNDMTELLTWYRKLAMGYQTFYHLSHNPLALDDSIDVCQEGLSRASHSSTEDRGAILDACALALQLRAKRNASAEDLTLAISSSLEAVAATAHSRSKVMYLNNCGNMMDDRFKLLGRLDDLHEAIKLTRSALEYSPDGMLLRGTKQNIACKLLALPCPQDAELDEALTLLVEATGPDPLGNDIPPLWINNLSSAYRSRYYRHKNSEMRLRQVVPKDLDDLHTAIRIQRQVVRRVPQDDETWPSYAVNMAALLRERAEQTRDGDDLRAAFSFVLDAAISIPEGHIHRSRIMADFGQLHTLAKALGNDGIYEISIDSVRWTPPWEGDTIDFYQEALEDPLGSTISRMMAAVHLMTTYNRRGEYAEGVSVGIQVLDILHAANTRLLSRDDQQRVTAAFSDIAVETCALSIQAGYDAGYSLELLERGRGLILGLLIEDRSDVSALAAAHPEKAARFEQLRDEVNHIVQPNATKIDAATRQALVSRRDRKVRELNEVLQDIRSLPGQERFLKGPEADELQSRAKEGPLVVVNVADQRSDAILVTKSSIRVLPLPGLKKTDIRGWIEKDPTRWKKRSEKGTKNNLCREYLGWLWEVCVEPVLETLGILKSVPTTDADLPRIWWIGAGLASSLPFHAAGNHLAGSEANAFAYVISSYTPTIRALGYAWDRALELRQTVFKVKPELLVALMPTTPKLDGQRVTDLGSVPAELSVISDAVSSTHNVRPLNHPSRQDVLDRLAFCDMVHFSCHGFSEPKDPSNSFLVLQRPGEEPLSSPVAEKLTVTDISEARLTRARIAYLSACSTAENRAQALVDEVIHLASGFQVAGFPHVIGAMWPADDAVSGTVAGMFYEKISTANPADDRAVALALRQAVMNVRDRFPRQPLLWAEYVHIGA